LKSFDFRVFFFEYGVKNLENTGFSAHQMRIWLNGFLERRSCFVVGERIKRFAPNAIKSFAQGHGGFLK